jgi:ammonia channel protein AmtB
VFGVHALGGAWGALASGIFAATLGSGIESNAAQIMVQLKGIAFVIVFAPLATVAIVSALRWSSARSASPTRTRSWVSTSRAQRSAYGFAGGSVVSPSSRRGRPRRDQHGAPGARAGRLAFSSLRSS